MNISITVLTTAVVLRSFGAMRTLTCPRFEGSAAIQLDTGARLAIRKIDVSFAPYLSIRGARHCPSVRMLSMNQNVFMSSAATWRPWVLDSPDSNDNEERGNNYYLIKKWTNMPDSDTEWVHETCVVDLD